MNETFNERYTITTMLKCLKYPGRTLGKEELGKRNSFTGYALYDA